MRRAHGYNYQPLAQAPESNDAIEDENQRLAEELRSKVGALKSLSIDIGDEVRYQERIIRGIDEDMDRTGGFLSNTMNRVVRLGRNGHHKYMLYMMLFALFLFALLYFILKIR